MTAQPKPQIEATETVKPVGERTNKELDNALNAEVRAIKTRREWIADINTDINDREKRIDAIIDEQKTRLDKRRARPVGAQVGEKTNELT